MNINNDVVVEHDDEEEEEEEDVDHNDDFSLCQVTVLTFIKFYIYIY